MSDVVDRIRADPSGVAATVVTGVWLGALVLQFDWWLGAMLVGYVLVVPLVAMLFDPEEGESAPGESASDGDDIASDHDAALQELKRRYARGKLTDEQFERKLETLLEVETLEDVEDARAVDRDAISGVEREPDLERE